MLIAHPSNVKKKLRFMYRVANTPSLNYNRTRFAPPNPMPRRTWEYLTHENLHTFLDCRLVLAAWLNGSDGAFRPPRLAAILAHARPAGGMARGRHGPLPGAIPPTTWSRRRNGMGYATQGILWMTPLPGTGVSSPIVVGPRIFVTTEVADLVCLEKSSGRVLWIRSNMEFEGVSEEKRRANPAYAAKLAPLMRLLAMANADVVQTLNLQQPTAAMAPSRGLAPALVQKRKIEKQIQVEQLAIDKKGFERYWAQEAFGFSGPTPTSDGKHVCVFFTTGLTACYDLDGNRQWIHRGKRRRQRARQLRQPAALRQPRGGLGQRDAGLRRGHGQTARGACPPRPSNTYGSLFRLRSGNDLVAAFQWGFFVRVRDGQPIWDKGVFGDSVVTPIVENGVIFARVGYPRANDETAGFRAFPIPPSTEFGRIAPSYAFNLDWTGIELGADKKKSPFDRSFVASPLYVAGLIYQLTQGGGLFVNDAATGQLVYRKVLPLKPRTEYWSWAGALGQPHPGRKTHLPDGQPRHHARHPARQTVQAGSAELFGGVGGRQDAGAEPGHAGV